MVLEDQPARLRAQLVDLITEREEVLLAAEIDPSYAVALAQAASDYRNWPEGVAMPEELVQKNQEFLAYTEMRQRIIDHARSLRLAVRYAAEDMDRMRSIARKMGEGWPKRR
jgi:hypothetical protein